MVGSWTKRHRLKGLRLLSHIPPHYAAVVLNKNAGALLAVDLPGISRHATDVVRCAFFGPLVA